MTMRSSFGSSESPCKPRNGFLPVVRSSASSMSCSRLDPGKITTAALMAGEYPARGSRSSDRGAALRLQLPCGRSGVLGQHFRRPDRPPDQLAAAIRAPSCENSFGAALAKGAFEGADAGVLRVGRQVPVAAFAIGTEFEHRTRASLGSGRSATRLVSRLPAARRRPARALPSGALPRGALAGRLARRALARRLARRTRLAPRLARTGLLRGLAPCALA